MQSTLRSLLCTALFALAFAWLSPASAQATRTWVSGTGDDANPCSRTAPCKTFAGAISKTAASGEINCIDPGGYGAVTITKSMAIICDNVEAGVLVSGTNGIIVNGAGAVVVLSGLDFEGLGTGLSGVRFVQGAALHVRKSIIRGFQGGQSFGIDFEPSTAAKLFVSDVYISENGSSTAGGSGILLQPGAGGSIEADITRVVVANNQAGIRAVGSNGTVKASITESTISGNTAAGITSVSQGTSVQVEIDRTTSSGNAVGLNANGAAAILRVGHSVIVGNDTGAQIQNSATMTSYGTNQVMDNGATTTIPVTSQQ